MSTSAHSTLTLHIFAKGLPKPDHEYRFHPRREWRFDVCWPEHRLAVEVHGGVFSGGRHTRGAGFTRDREKVNAAVELGWRVLEYSTAQVVSGAAIKQIERILKGRDSGVGSEHEATGTEGRARGVEGRRAYKPARRAIRQGTLATLGD